MYKKFLPILIFASGLALFSHWFCNDVFGGSTNLVLAVTPNVPPSTESVLASETFRSYLQLQEQLHETQLSLERSEKEMELATLKSAAILSNRLQAIEQTVELQRAHEMEIVRDMMYIAGAFVVIGVLSLLFTSYFHWRAVSRLGEIAAALPAMNGLATTSPLPALGLGENRLLLEQTNSRLIGAVERLEKRIAELETHDGGRQLTGGSPVVAPLAARPELTESPEVLPAMSVQATKTTTSTATGSERFVAPSEQVLMLLGKGQTLLSQDQTEQAVACFDEALALDPTNTELLVKKGDALEKLRRTKEALECYDRALAIDDSMTIAYLHKGGLLNRVERFDEAMHCYEQALRTQDKDRAV